MNDHASFAEEAATTQALASASIYAALPASTISLSAAVTSAADGRSSRSSRGIGIVEKRLNLLVWGGAPARVWEPITRPGENYPGRSSPVPAVLKGWRRARESGRTPLRSTTATPTPPPVSAHAARLAYWDA
jgi:hypothetical protein